MSPAITFAAEAASSPRPNTIYARSAKKPKMSITQTYFLAHSARGKLSKEASRADHDLRLLVGHANMLDSLMLDLASAEQEQERWFNHSIPTTVIPEVEEETSPEDLAMEDEPEEEQADWDVEDAESTDSEDDEDLEEGLTLVRTKSRHSHSPPELTSDNESESDSEEDENMMMPPSPPDEPMDSPLAVKAQQGNTTFYETTKEISLSSTEAESFEEDGFFIPARSRTTIIAAC